MAHGYTLNKDDSKDDPSKSGEKKTPQLSSIYKDNIHRAQATCNALMEKRGVHSVTYMSSAGFQYTGDADTARCEHCGLQVSNWTIDMQPFAIHSKQKPHCRFVRSMITSSLSNAPSSLGSSTTNVRKRSISNEQKNPSKRQKIETIDSESLTNTLTEPDLLQQVRRRTFSHWPHRPILSSAQMIEAGFFNCNVGDRVICIYCNLICAHWTPYVDNPSEVHKQLSPNCIYVKSHLIRHGSPPIINANGCPIRAVAGSPWSASHNINTLRLSQYVDPFAENDSSGEIRSNLPSFSTYSNSRSPSIDDQIQANYFSTESNSDKQGFSCDQSLPNWSQNDNPMIERSRWSPHCAYATQLCSDELHRKIQESIRAQQERARASELRGKAGSGVMLNANPTTNSRQLLIPDESTLSRLVAARLDLPISQSLLDRSYRLSIIKRCWEDQLRLKGEDFVSECDLKVACLIHQKQIEHIDGKKENIVIPSVRMRQIRQQAEKEHAEILAQRQTAATSISRSATRSRSMNASTGAYVEVTTSSQSLTNETTSSTSNNQNQSHDSSPSNPCVLCLMEEKRLACIPCGHLATCVPCGHSLHSCPICRRKIDAVVRIYI